MEDGDKRLPLVRHFLGRQTIQMERGREKFAAKSEYEQYVWEWDIWKKRTKDERRGRCLFVIWCGREGRARGSRMTFHQRNSGGEEGGEGGGGAWHKQDHRWWEVRGMNARIAG